MRRHVVVISACDGDASCGGFVTLDVGPATAVDGVER